jgi:hypothetical protein
MLFRCPQEQREPHQHGGVLVALSHFPFAPPDLHHPSGRAARGNVPFHF